MKKKFVLTLALVLMVAVSLSAATPVVVSGVFDFGYEVSIDDGVTTSLDQNSNLSTFVAVSSDYWKVTLGAYTGTMFADEVALESAKADIYLDKALADEGIDMGDLAVTLHVGVDVGNRAATVFANKNEWHKKSFEFRAGAGAANLGTTFKYGDLVELYLAADVDGGAFRVIGAKTAPVDGVTAALGYAVDNKLLAASVAVDVAALAGLDFDLGASLAYQGDFENEGTKVLAGVAGAYQGIGLWVEFVTDLDIHRLAAKASYATTLEGVDLDAGVKVSIDDFSDIEVGVAFDASAAYTMGGVKYKLALGYELKDAFTITPSVSFSF